ncbi:MAG: hypothetical protein H6834_14140 [Planctomycetes bacterium]|nr:hypothetical protein [Planctomycetota bacterium]
MMLLKNRVMSSGCRKALREKGFTLVETMVMGAVVAVLAAGVMSPLPPMMKAADDASRIAEATALLEHAMAEIAEVPFENLSSLDGLVIDETALSATALADIEGFTAHLDHVAMSPTLHKVEIEVRYRPPGVQGPSEKVLIRSVVYRSPR